eukprot:CAMPEP_0170472162 /NCGR_PEP_ID=MMETSP0123-20130129/14244_1 /TAXON_ID=182087 /ORGANISM="Favella ehrenbergii, Strain Fehren 1" /LENGTH=62 /DNA_ID=CAMNT_0010740259 /DNA_START=315 /DNA_END=503 /DNA_ORIENTATION=-
MQQVISEGKQVGYKLDEALELKDSIKKCNKITKQFLGALSEELKFSEVMQRAHNWNQENSKS